MKSIIAFVGMLLLFATSYAQNVPGDFKTTVINKQIKDFPDKFDLSTPLNAGLTCYYLLINGTNRLWGPASTQRFQIYFSPDAPDAQVNETQKEALLNDSIIEVITYKDSIAGMITRSSANSQYRIRIIGLENGKWVNCGEDIRETLAEARYHVSTLAPRRLSENYRLSILNKVSTDTLAFVNYAKQQGKSPEDFMLDALASHKLVIYGEVHRRKLSWDVLREIIKAPRFAQTVGAVFMELPTSQQSAFDRFYSNEKLDTEVLLDIFRAQQMYGWWDRGEYEFLVDLWHLNQQLPKNKRIKVISADMQPPYHLLNTSEDRRKFMENYPDRNETMANTIEQIIKTNKDKRHNLFIVGYGHAYRSKVPAGYSESAGRKPLLSAGAILTERFSKEDVFVVFQHGPVINNSGTLFGKIRKGLYDTVFAQLGDKPIAFNLQNSPFGAEPFDADYDMGHQPLAGSYEDNFDGYIFLGPLRDEPADYILYEIWTDKFVKEMQRRYSLMDGTRTLRDDWSELKEISGAGFIQYFREKYPDSRRRWSKLYE